jgi:hypothetical protein
LFFKKKSNDIGISGIIYPLSTNPINTEIVPRARVYNHGSTTQYNFPVVCSIVSSGGALRYTNTQTVSSLAADSTILVDFTTWTPIIAEQCIVKMRTNLIGDEFTGNDRMTKTTNIRIFDWTSIASPSTVPDRMNNATVYDPVNDKIYMIGGWPYNLRLPNGPYQNLCQQYDPVTNTWTDKAPMPLARLAFQGSYVKGKIYIMCGGDYWMRTDNQEYTIATNSWALKAPVPSAHCGAMIGVWRDSLIFVMGGADDQTGDILATVAIYNPSTNSWTTGTSLPTYVSMGSCVIVGDTIYITNAYDGHDSQSDTCWANLYKGAINPLDATQIIWIPGPTINDRVGLASSTVLNNKIYCLGGCVGYLHGGHAVDTCRVYNIQTGRFDTIINYPIPLTGSNNLVARSATNELYVIAGDAFGDLQDPNNYYYKIQIPSALNDVAVTDVRFFPTMVVVGDSIQVKMKIQNLGVTAPTSIPVSYRTLVGTVHETWSGRLAFHDTTIYTFTHKYYVSTMGTVAVKCSTALANDENSANDTLTKSLLIHALHDAAVTAITSPTSAETTRVAFQPHVTISNNGAQTDEVPAIAEIWQSTTIVYRDSINIPVPVVKGTAEATFKPCTLTTQGSYTFKGYTKVANDADPANDTMIRSFSANSVTLSLQVPEDGALINDNTPTFTWDAVPGVSKYRIQVDDENTFTEPWTINALTSTNSFTVSSEKGKSSSTDILKSVVPDKSRLALVDGHYYWRVRSESIAPADSWSQTYTFDLDATAPEAPILISPLNGIWLTNANVIFNWSQVTLNDSKIGRLKDAKILESSYPQIYIIASPIRYILQVDTSRNFTNPFNDTTSLIYDTLILPQARYFWRVRSYDLAGNHGTFSSRDSFGIDYTAPSIPNLISPANNGVLADSFVQFVWNRSTDNVSGIRNYRLQVAVDTNFSSPIDTLTQDSTITLLLRNTRCWRVKAIDRANNQSNWSQRRMFMVTGIEEISSVILPTTFSLLLNAPNPFLRSTEIRYSIPITCNIKMTIFNSSGKEMICLVNKKQNPGCYSVKWDGRDTKGKLCPNGIYFYRLQTNEYQTTRKMLMLK